MWNVEMRAFGASEEVNVEGEDVAAALANALEELGVGDNDEVSMTLVISGDSGSSDEAEPTQPKQRKSHVRRMDA